MMGDDHANRDVGCDDGRARILVEGDSWGGSWRMESSTCEDFWNSF